MITDIQRQDILRAAAFPLPWEKLYGKTVLVTGAAGFIGSFIVYTLLAHAQATGHRIKVIAVVRDKEKAKRKLDAAGPITYVVSDVTVSFTCDEPVDYMIHCASNAAPDQYSADPVGTIKTNLYGTLNSLDCAARCKAGKYLYVSTIEVYGRTKGEGTLSEDDYGYISPMQIRSCYPESKKCSEALAVSYGRQYGLDVTVARLSYIYGAGMSTTDSKICALWAREVAQNKNPVLKSKGLQKRSYTYISDAVTGLLTAMLCGESGQAYNVAWPQSVITVAGMAGSYCGLFPEKKLKVQYELPKSAEKAAFSLIEDAVMDAEKLRALGWYAEVPVREGLLRSVQYYMELGERTDMDW